MKYMVCKQENTVAILTRQTTDVNMFNKQKNLFTQHARNSLVVVIDVFLLRTLKICLNMSTTLL